MASEPRRAVTAQERQREREEKRKKRQERAKEREKKLKEKERREGKQGDSLGGVLLSDNDKSLLQRWTMMVDRRNDRAQLPPHNDGPKSQGCSVNHHQVVPSNKADKEAGSVQCHQQVVAAHQGLFQPNSTLYSLGQRKPPADLAVASAGGMKVMSVAAGFVNNGAPLKAPSESNGQDGFSCLGNWSGGQQVETRLLPQQPSRKLQPATASFLQPTAQSNPELQSQSQQLLPLENFLAKPPASTSREKNGLETGGLSNPNTGSDPSVADCTSRVGEKSRPQTTNPLCEVLAAQSQPHHSLTFTDTGQQGPTNAPDIHTVTLQLSKSQVCGCEASLLSPLQRLHVITAQHFSAFPDRLRPLSKRMKVTDKHLILFLSLARLKTSYPPCFPSLLKEVGQATAWASTWTIFLTSPLLTCNTVIGTGGHCSQPFSESLLEPGVCLLVVSQLFFLTSPRSC